MGHIELSLLAIRRLLGLSRTAYGVTNGVPGCLLVNPHNHCPEDPQTWLHINLLTRFTPVPQKRPLQLVYAAFTDAHTTHCLIFLKSNSFTWFYLAELEMEHRVHTSPHTWQAPASFVANLTLWFRTCGKGKRRAGKKKKKKGQNTTSLCMTDDPEFFKALQDTKSSMNLSEFRNIFKKHSKGWKGSIKYGSWCY